MTQMVAGNKIPLYRQLATTMMQRIRTSDYRPGETLPSIRSISNEFNVSINVVQRAIRELERDGIVLTQHGKEIRVTDTVRAEKAAIVFGMIHPYAGGMAFGRDVLYYAGQTFSSRNNLLFTVSSGGDAARERHLARHLVNNGARGLLIWPVESDSNADFFDAFARRTPTVLIDRMLVGSTLPAVTHNTYAAGRDVCEEFFVRARRERLLVLMDDLDISPYESLLRGVRDRAKELGRFTDLTTVQLPLSEVIGQINQCDFSQVDQYASYIERLIRDSGYDAMFCYQDDFLDYVLIETGVIDRFPGLKLGCTRSAGINTRSRKFVEANPVGWAIDHIGAISLAADRLQEWVLTKQRFNESVQLELKRNPAC
jgi:DNA-binding transcriptional regulator YhcF (GntR family)